MLISIRRIKQQKNIVSTYVKARKMLTQIQCVCKKWKCGDLNRGHEEQG
jgi:hypothetical protein